MASLSFPVTFYCFLPPSLHLWGLVHMTYEFRRKPLSYRTSFSEKLFQRTRVAGRASRYSVFPAHGCRIAAGVMHTDVVSGNSLASWRRSTWERGQHYSAFVQTEGRPCNGEKGWAVRGKESLIMQIPSNFYLSCYMPPPHPGRFSETKVLCIVFDVKD